MAYKVAVFYGICTQFWFIYYSLLFKNQRHSFISENITIKIASWKSIVSIVYDVLILIINGMKCYVNFLHLASEINLTSIGLWKASSTTFYVEKKRTERLQLALQFHACQLCDVTTKKYLMIPQIAIAKLWWPRKESNNALAFFSAPTTSGGRCNSWSPLSVNYCIPSGI